MTLRDRVLLAVYLFLVISTTGFLQPFVPLYLDAAGLNRPTFGLVMGLATGLMLVVQPFLGRLSDRLDMRRPFIFGAALSTGIAYLSFPYAHSPVTFFFLLAIGVNGTAYCQQVGGVLVGRLVAGKRGGSDYASLRVWGSVGYILVSITAGLIVNMAGPHGFQRVGLDPVFRAGPLLFLAVACIVWFLPDPRSEGTHAERTQKAPLPDNLRRFLFAYFIYTFALYGSSPFISLFLKSLGASGLWITGTFGAGVICEVLVMRRSGALSDIYGRRPALALAFVILPIRLLLYAPATSPGWVAVVQSLHGLNFGIVGAVAVAFTMDLATERTHGHAQARLAAVGGVATALGPAFFGVVSNYLGLRDMFVAAAVIAAIGAAVLIFTVEDSHTSPASIADRAPVALRPMLRWLNAPTRRRDTAP